MRLIKLAEARKNWDHPAQRKVYGADLLRKYADDPDVYISYTGVEKLGINPKNKFQTPHAIYTYPLKEVFGGMNDADSVRNVPFAGDRRFIWVCKSTKPVMELSTYDNLDNDIEKMTRYLEKNTYWEKNYSSPAELINASISDARKMKNMAAARMWNITRIASRSSYDDTNTSRWNYILRVVLGYSAISDKTGMGLIHPSEAIQTMFLSRDALKVIDKIINAEPNIEAAMLAKEDNDKLNFKNHNIGRLVDRKILANKFYANYEKLEHWVNDSLRNVDEENINVLIDNYELILKCEKCIADGYNSADKKELRLLYKTKNEILDAVGTLFSIRKFARETLRFSDRDDAKDSLNIMQRFIYFYENVEKFDSSINISLSGIKQYIAKIKEKFDL